MRWQRIHKIRIWLIVVLLLLACAAPSLTTPQSMGTTTLAPAVLDTVVAETVAAAQTQTIVFLPTSTNTFTPSATHFPTHTPITLTSTPTFVIIFTLLTKATSTQETPTSAIQVIPISSSSNSSSNGATLSPADERATRFPKTPVPWDCVVTGKGPPRGTLIKPKSSFEITWTVLNNGTRAWTSNTIDFIYTGGFRSNERPIQDLGRTVAAGGSITLVVHLIASKFPGTYNTFWSLRVGNTNFCHMKNTFEIGTK